MMMRQPGQVWVKRYGPVVEFTPKQSAEVEELMYTWTKQDFETIYRRTASAKK